MAKSKSKNTKGTNKKETLFVINLHNKEKPSASFTTTRTYTLDQACEFIHSIHDDEVLSLSEDENPSQEENFLVKLDDHTYEDHRWIFTLKKKTASTKVKTKKAKTKEKEKETPEDGRIVIDVSHLIPSDLTAEPSPIFSWVDFYEAAHLISPHHRANYKFNYYKIYSCNTLTSIRIMDFLRSNRESHKKALLSGKMKLRRHPKLLSPKQEEEFMQDCLSFQPCIDDTCPDNTIVITIK